MSGEGLRAAVEQLARSYDEALDTHVSPAGAEVIPLVLRDLRALLAEHPAPTSGLHACDGCGVELDGDDRHSRCDDCEPAPSSGRCACGALDLATTVSERHDRGLHGPHGCIGSLSWTWNTTPPSGGEVTADEIYDVLHQSWLASPEFLPDHRAAAAAILARFHVTPRADA